MRDYIADLRKLVGSRPLLMCGACALVLDDENRLLLCRRTDNDTWGLPGGATELGERLEQTAARETLEEVGLICHELTLFGVYSGPDLYYRYPNGDEVYNVTVSYLCRYFSGAVHVDRTEHTEAAFFPLDGLPQPIAPPIQPIVDDFVRRFDETVADRP